MVHMNDDPRGSHSACTACPAGSLRSQRQRLCLRPRRVLAQQDRPAPVQIARAEVRELAPSVLATGIVRSRAAADLAAAVDGRLQFVAEPGTAVKAGQVVARLDTREMSLARAEQAARVKRAQVNLTALDRELDRLRASGNAVSRFNVDQAQSNRDLAEADLQVARASLAQTRRPAVALALDGSVRWRGVRSRATRRRGSGARRDRCANREPRRTRDPPVRALASRARDPAGPRGRRRRGPAPFHGNSQHHRAGRRSTHAIV